MSANVQFSQTILAKCTNLLTYFKRFQYTVERFLTILTEIGNFLEALETCSTLCTTLVYFCRLLLEKAILFASREVGEQV